MFYFCSIFTSKLISQNVLYINMKVFHVVKKEMKELKSPYVFLDGDVYVIETDTNLWVWLGKQSYADDKAVGAWAAKVLEEENKKLEIKTVIQDDEPEEFKAIIDFKVEHGDTPGFLKHIDTKKQKDFRLLHIEQSEDGSLVTKEIPIDYKLFESDDAFILDAYDEIYVWLGKNSQVKEKYEAGRISRELDVERKRVPLIFTIEEENEPPNFKELVAKIARKDGVLEMRKVKRPMKKKDVSKKWWQFWK